MSIKIGSRVVNTSKWNAIPLYAVGTVHASHIDGCVFKVRFDNGQWLNCHPHEIQVLIPLQGAYHGHE